MASGSNPKSKTMSEVELAEYQRIFKENLYQRTIERDFGGMEQPWVRARIEEMDLKAVHDFTYPPTTTKAQLDIVSRHLKDPNFVGRHTTFDDEE